MSSFIAKANAIITMSDAYSLRGASLLDSVNLSNVIFKGVAPLHLMLSDCVELTSILLTNSEGLAIPKTLKAATSPGNHGAIAKEWAGLTKLKTLNLSGCGLSLNQQINLMRDMVSSVSSGMGSAATGKTLVLTGANEPLGANAEATALKASLLAKGWVVTNA